MRKPRILSCWSARELQHPVGPPPGQVPSAPSSGASNRILEHRWPPTSGPTSSHACSIACSSSARPMSRADRKPTKSSSKNALSVTSSAGLASSASTSLPWLPPHEFLRSTPKLRAVSLRVRNRGVVLKAVEHVEHSLCLPELRRPQIHGRRAKFD